MAIGDDAVDAGLEVVDPGADIRLAWQEINRTRDYLAVLMMRVPEFSTGFGLDGAGKAVVRGDDGYIGGDDPTYVMHYANKRYVDSYVAYQFALRGL